ncbi:MAG: hypothetical protein AUG07_00065 [Acidobacteria bacterium 13_1_20CM_2_60_10]|nr:MAG: hypothetical protein AUG07_00065 [Acidobacteria bacterium 13_1_20CM_2_60_10]
MSGWLVTWRDDVLLAGSEQLEQMGDVLLVAVINLGIVPLFRTAAVMAGEIPRINTELARLGSL